MMLEDGQEVNGDELRRETTPPGFFYDDTTLARWHGRTIAGQEYRYDIETSKVTLLVNGEPINKKPSKVNKKKSPIIKRKK